MTLSLDQLAEAIHTARSGIPWEVTSQQDLAFRDAHAVLTAIEQAGYVVVPREATEQMIAAGLETNNRFGKRAMGGIWSAMLQSAPKIGDDR